MSSKGIAASRNDKGMTWMQKLRLGAIAKKRDGVAWRNDATDKSLLRRGLIERCDTTEQLAPGVKFTTHLCRIKPSEGGESK